VYHTAFTAGITYQRAKIHCTELPEPPPNWSEMLAHPQQAGFETAAQIEYRELQERGTFTLVPETEASFMIPTKWVFTNKFDEEGYLLKHKARLVVQGDLQLKQDKETYAATLATRLFQFLMAITAYFDLEAYQFDTINAFLNTKLNHDKKV
jgi:hypothetical protein